MGVYRSIWAAAVLGLYTSAAVAQEPEGAFYRYNGAKIMLKPAPDVIAAKVLESVDYRAKFPRVERYFTEVGTSALKNEPVLVQSSSAITPASSAIAAGVQAKEIYRLPVFEVDSARVIVQNELLVGFKPDHTSGQAEELIRRFSRTFAKQPGERLRYLVRVPDPSRTLAWAEILYQNKTVAYAEPNMVIVQPSRPESPSTSNDGVAIADAGVANEAAPTGAFPSDLLFSQQWALQKIEAPKAWLTSRGRSTVRVAVLDDGIDVDHPDLASKIDGRYDMIFDSPAMIPPPADSHGTAVAGIAAAVTHNGLGVAAVAPEVKLIAIRMMSRVDAATESNSLVTISNAFQKALELGADVINCSWTMPIPSKDVEEAVNAVLSVGRGGRGAVVVFAAGNQSRDVSFPATLSTRTAAIAVAATNQRDEMKTATSSDGETHWGSNYGPEITIGAPGVHILTTTHRGAVANGAAPFIATFNGTSSAAPFVAGVAALILSEAPDLSASEVKERIVASGEKVLLMPGAPPRTVGRLNACRALNRSDCR